MSINKHLGRKKKEVYSRRQEHVLFSCEYVRDVSISQQHDVIRYTHIGHLERGGDLSHILLEIRKVGKHASSELWY
jgi:hypothetical protein